MHRSCWVPLFTAALLVSTAASAYQETEVAHGGTIRGRVTFLGRPPTPRAILVTKDEDYNNLNVMRGNPPM